jgi:hypothetical protein
MKHNIVTFDYLGAENLPIMKGLVVNRELKAT